MQTQATTADKLEVLVDEIGLVVVLEYLRGICFAKAEHLRTNWQDEDAAERWEAYGEILYGTDEEIGNVE